MRCVVFDIDDTLYLERDYVQSGFRAVGRWVTREWGAGGFFETAWAAFERGVRGTIFNTACRELGLTDDAERIRELVRVYREHRPDIALLPDARTCLDALASRCRLAGITDGPLASQRAKAQALGLHAWLRPLIFTAELGQGYGKPHPRAYRAVEAAVGARGQALAYLADNPAKDFRAPRDLGWRTVRIRRPGSLHETVESGPDVDVERESLADVPALLIG